MSERELRDEQAQAAVTAFVDAPAASDLRVVPGTLLPHVRGRAHEVGMRARSHASGVLRLRCPWGTCRRGGGAARSIRGSRVLEVSSCSSDVVDESCVTCILYWVAELRCHCLRSSS